MIERGSSFGGYTIERQLGSGGMGVVYEAVQRSLDRRVALKILKPELATDPAFVDRFRREGRLQAKIEHPHVLDVYEVGESDDHDLFLAMRLVDGPTLADLLRVGELDAARTVDLLGQVGEALDAANGAGLVHRDVKPQNVLVGDGDHAFLADFGLSRIGTDPESRSRPTVGTVAYVAPEVVAGESPGPASDRYAFAATLFHCLTGDVVFPRGSEAAALYAHASEPPPRISARRPELPAALDQVFEEALAKDPGRRPASARGLVASVRERLVAAGVADLGPPRLGPPSGVSPETLPPATAPASATARASGGDRAPGRGRLTGILAIVALLAALLGAGVATLLGDGDGGGDGEEAGAAVPVPAVPSDAQALGSSLEAPDREIGCEGEAAEPASEPCALAQTELGATQLVAPADGLITGWAVRGASGEIALDVIRPRGADTTRVARSQWESAGNSGSFHFSTSLPVERGDLIAVELGRGSAIGVRDADGATIERWSDTMGGAYGDPDPDDKVPAGLESELLLRADFVAGATTEPPEALTGRAVESAPEGKVRDRRNVRISEPAATVQVELVEVGDRVALDLLDGKRRIQRVFIPGLLPGGLPAELDVYVYDGSSTSEVDVYWVNPSSGRLNFHFFTVSAKQLELVI
ncbi:MAG: serine/threonine-protein kinase [Solirubrobacterales bacterium]